MLVDDFNTFNYDKKCFDDDYVCEEYDTTEYERLWKSWDEMICMCDNMDVVQILMYSQVHESFAI
jgi:hypothetical protein